MDSGREIEAQGLEFHKIEEVFEDKDSVIFYTIFSFVPVNQLKTKITTFQDQGTDLHGVLRSHFYFFCPEQTLNFPYRVEWCV